jgi:peptidoglycan-N-acetylglucosamine deacetylase
VRGGGWEFLSRSARIILAFLLAFGLGTAIAVAAIAVAAGWTQERFAGHSQNAPPQERAERASSAYRTTMSERPKVDIALTFDDGPDPNNTPKVLDALKRYDAKATFFVRGDQARAYPNLVRREYQEGHVVGNHSYDHPRLTTLTKPEVERQLRDTNEAITAAGAPKPKLFRPPWGATDADVERVADSLGMTQTLWEESAIVDEWGEDLATPASVCDQTVASAEPGAILLLHDGFTPSTADALPCILRRLKAQGYEFGLIYPSSTHKRLNRSDVQIR